MKRIFIIAAMAAMFCMVACAPQPEVSAPEVEQNIEGDETTKVEGEDNSQSTNEGTASGDSADAVEPEEPVTNGDDLCDEAPPARPYVLVLDQDPYMFATWKTLNTSKKSPENVGWVIAFNSRRKDLDGWRADYDAWSKEHSEVMTNIQNEMVKHSYDGSIYFNAPYEIHYVNGRITNLEITADQTLWGVEPGGNLMDMWEVYSAVSPMLFSYPNGEYVGDLYDLTGRLDWYNEDFPEVVDWRTELMQCYAPSRIYFKMGEKVFEEKPDVVFYTVKVTFNNEITFECIFGVRYEYE